MAGRGLVLLSVAFGFLAMRTTLSDWAYERASLRADQIPLRDAVEAAKKALNYDDGNAQALAFLGDSHRNLASQQKNNDNRLAEGQLALDAYQKALRADPLDDSVEFRMGLTLDVMQKYSEALPHYRAAVAAQPHNGLYWYSLSNHYLDSGDLAQADAAMNQVRHCFHRTEWFIAWEKKRRAINAADAGSQAQPAIAPTVKAQQKPAPSP